LRSVYTAIHDGRADNEVLAVKYLDTLARIADGQATKIFLPSEMAGLFGTVGGLAELLRQEDTNGSGAIQGETAPAGVAT